MIKKIDWYIAKTIMLSTLMIILIVLGLDYFIQFLGELNDIGTGGYSLFQAMFYVLLRLPHDFYQLLPMAAFLGALVGLGQLSSNSELIALRTSGVSVFKIAKATLFAGIVIIVMSALIGELLAPMADHKAMLRKDIATSGGQAFATTSQGVWIHTGNDFVHVDKMHGTTHLIGVTAYKFNKQHELTSASQTKTIDFQGDKWIAKGTNETIFYGDHTTNKYIKSAIWPIKIKTDILKIGLIQPEEMTLVQMHRFVNYQIESGLQASDFQLSFWMRIFQPLATLVMIFLAIPYVFAAPRSTSAGWRTVLGIIIGFTFYILNKLLGQVSLVYQLSPILSALFPILLFGLLALAMMRRVK